MRGLKSGGLAGLPAIAVFAAATALLAAGAAGGGPRPRPQLDSRLAQVAAVAEASGNARALRYARRVVPDAVEGGRLEVEIVRPTDGRHEVAQAVAAAGGRLDGEYRELAEAEVPAAALSVLAHNPEIELIQPPARPEPEVVAGQGVVASGAGSWQQAGNGGAGVKVGVIDLGFGGYTARRSEGELPSDLVTYDLCDPGGFDGPDAEVHGTGVAEIVHEMAPQAKLYLICVENTADLGNAKDYAKANRIRIVNHSVGWFNSARGDGTGGPTTPEGIAGEAADAGILWVNAAGNHAQEHWSGTFSDPDANGWENFGPGQEQDGLVSPAFYDQVCAYLKWDEWPAASTDYDLYLYSGTTVLAQSTNPQTGTQSPTERICYSLNGEDPVGVAIRRLSGSGTPRLDLFVSGPNLQLKTAAGSLVEPASSPKVLAVGAICWGTNALEDYSSLGPTIDGRVKPDIAGQTGVSSATYGAGNNTCTSPSGFYGTSAASPHLAGAAALVAAAHPEWSATEIRGLLETRALDQGPPGKDNDFGIGVLKLGPAIAQAPPADLAVASSVARDPAVVGEELAYTITVSNAGPGAAAQVQVAESLPAGAFFVSATSGQGPCSGSGPVICSLGTIPAGATATATVVVTPGTPGTLTATGTVSATTVDPNPANDSGGTTSTARAAVADLGVTGGHSPTRVVATKSVTERITLTNAGPDTAHDVAVGGTAPPRSTVLSATTPQGSCTVQGGFDCLLGSLGSGSTVTVEVVLRATRAGSIALAATASSTTSDPNAGNNTSSDTIEATALRLTATKLRTTPKHPRPGGKLTVRAAVTANDTGGPVGSGSVACSASAAGRRLTTSAKSFLRGVAVCTWRIPKGAGGAQVSGSVRLGYKGAVLTRRFHTRVAKH